MQLPPCQRHQLHLQLEGWAGLQCPNTQTPVSKQPSLVLGWGRGEVIPCPSPEAGLGVGCCLCCFSFYPWPPRASAPVSLHFRSYCCPFPGAHSSPVSCSTVSFLLPAFPAPYICLASSLHAATVLRVGPPRPLHPNSSALVPRPDLIDFDKLKDSNARHNLEHAFDVAERQLGIIPLLDPEGEPRPLSSLPGGWSRCLVSCRHGDVGAQSGPCSAPQWQVGFQQTPGLWGGSLRPWVLPHSAFGVHGSDVDLITV